MSRRHRFVVLGFGCCLQVIAAVAWHPAIAGDARRQQIGHAIAAAMEEHGVPGASLAIVNHGNIDWAEGYGRLAATGDDMVTSETLFQAASISKPVTAAGALSLVEVGKLDLDAKVNDLLKSWKIPDNATTKEHPIKLRHLLSHTAGLTVHGFPGYAQDASRPSLLEILDGKEPANTRAIQPHLKPGYRFLYSGGGYCVLQQLLLDTTESPFPQFMQTRVLAPLGMSHSTYEQPLPQTRAGQSAKGHREKKAVILGGCNVYPEMAAAGLWTTPGDLATFAIDLSKSFTGKGGKLLSQNTVRQMLTAEKGTYGLGLAVRGEGEALAFSHGGANEGYRCLMIAYPATGQGLAIMTNSDTGGAMFNDVVKLVGELYQWPKSKP
ncbi:MAG: serine hydrolase domain-containing protein [Pirellulales bacterium]